MEKDNFTSSPSAEYMCVISKSSWNSSCGRQKWVEVSYPGVPEGQPLAQANLARLLPLRGASSVLGRPQGLPSWGAFPDSNLSGCV